jgi:hypothetical protein
MFLSASSLRPLRLLSNSRVLCVGIPLVMRLCRLPCGKPPAFRSAPRNEKRLRLGGLAAKTVAGLTESQRLSARGAAKPQTIPKFHLVICLSKHAVKLCGKDPNAQPQRRREHRGHLEKDQLEPHLDFGFLRKVPNSIRARIYSLASIAESGVPVMAW